MSFEDGDNFPHPHTLGEPDDGTDLVGDDALDGGEEQEGPSAEEQLEQLRAQMARYETQNQTLQGTINTLLQGRAPEGATQEQPAEFNLDDLPDPVENHAEFKRQLADRIRNFNDTSVQQATGRVQQQVTQQQKLDNVWSKFRQEHPELAKRESLLRGVVLAETDQMRAQGVQDPGAALLADPDGFITRIAGKMRSELGESEEGKPAAGRTRGVAGGSRKGGKGGGQQKQPPGFLEQLKKRKLEMGLN